MQFFCFLFIFILLLPTTLSAAMTGGDFEIYADSFSVVQDQLTTSGGNFTLTNTGGEPSGILGSTATGTIVVGMSGMDFGIEADPTFTLGDGIVTTTFKFENGAGMMNGELTGSGQVIVDTGGGGGGFISGMTNRVAEAINSVNALVEIYAVSDGVDTVTLTNIRTSGVDGNVPITENIAGSFVVTGMSGGGNISTGIVLKGGFQAMERASLSMSVDPSTVALGQLSLAAVSSGSVVMTVTTDSSSGYAVSATEDGNLRKGVGGANDDINDVVDGTVSAGSEEYGIVTSGGGGLLAVDTALSGTLSVASSNSNVTAQQTTITFKAAIGSSSRAGSYSHIVTFTATANP